MPAGCAMIDSDQPSTTTSEMAANRIVGTRRQARSASPPRTSHASNGINQAIADEPTGLRVTAVPLAFDQRGARVGCVGLLDETAPWAAGEGAPDPPAI